MADPVAVLPAAGGRRLRLTPTLAVGIVMLVVTAGVALVASVALTGAADGLSPETNRPASGAHWLGTDAFGRDMLARALVGAQASLVMAGAATAFSMVLGVVIGTAVWVASRRAREVALRAIEIAVSYPELLVAVVIAAIVGSGRWQVVFAVGLANIPATARLTANLSAAVHQRDFVTTARLTGAPPWALIGRHLLPNMAEPLLIQLAATFSTGLVAMSALSFVGLGVQTPDYDLGRLLADGLPAIYSRPLEVVGPTLMILLLSVAAMLIGDGLAATADPRAGRGRATGRGTVAQDRDERPVAARAGGPTGSTGSTGSTDPADPLVAVRDLVVRRADGVDLVRGVSFTIGPGEIVGVVGESGSGKSLTAMALARLLPDGLTADAAELRVGGMDMLGSPPRQELAAGLGLVYQDPGTTFNPALRMESQLTEVLRVHQGRSAAEAREIVADRLAAVHIADPARLLRSHPYELSGGMRQRSMIASALAADPLLLVADEPTTALDVTVQAEILRELARLTAETGTSMLFISHDVGVVEELCRRVLVMKDGMIVEELTGAALRAGDVTDSYTRMLLESVPRLSVPAAGAP